VKVSDRSEIRNEFEFVKEVTAGKVRRLESEAAAE